MQSCCVKALGSWTCLQGWGSTQCQLLDAGTLAWRCDLFKQDSHGHRIMRGIKHQRVALYVIAHDKHQPVDRCGHKPPVNSTTWGRRAEAAETAEALGGACCKYSPLPFKHSKSL